jgi:hypothetical protein
MSRKRKNTWIKGAVTAQEVYERLSPAEQRKANGVLRRVFISRSITPKLNLVSHSEHHGGKCSG